MQTIPRKSRSTRGKKKRNEEQGVEKRAKWKQTVVNPARTSRARVPVSLVHIGSNLQTRLCHVAGKRSARVPCSLSLSLSLSVFTNRVSPSSLFFAVTFASP